MSIRLPPSPAQAAVATTARLDPQQACLDCCRNSRHDAAGRNWCKSTHLILPHSDGQVKGLARANTYAALPEELHRLDLVVHQQGGRFLDIEEGPLQGVQVPVICLQAALPAEPNVCGSIAWGTGRQLQQG